MSSICDQLEDCCAGLSSAKVTARKKSAEVLLGLLDAGKVSRYLNQQNQDNEDKDISWDNIVKSVHIYLTKEAEKIQVDDHKKGTSGFYRKIGHDLLIRAVRQANTGKIRLTVTDLIKYVMRCFKSETLKKYFSETYIIVLKDYILSESRYHGLIGEEEWRSLLIFLKSHFTDGLCDDSKVIQCLELLLKWGPVHQLPMVLLRDEFPFITTLCRELKSSSSKAHQESILRILVQFCHQNCRDCCMACCKLGEAVFPNIRTLYDSRTNDVIKGLLIEFFLSQVRLHHPKGSCEGSPSAYAFSWPEWNKQMRTIYFIVHQEVNNSLRSSFKSNPLFYLNNEKRIHSSFLTLTVEVCKQMFRSGIENMTQILLQDCSFNTTAPPAKKPKIEVGMSALITDIQESKSWQWINIMTELLGKYPDVIEVQDFMNLLQVLSNLQSECKDADLQCHIYECFCVLLGVQKRLQLASEMPPQLEQLWSVTWESALRSAGLNQNIRATHKLLQKLMLERKTISSLQLFETYASGVLTVTGFAMETLDVASHLYGVPETISNYKFRKRCTSWILNVDGEKCLDSDVYSEEVAKLLVCLCLKQWPPNCRDDSSHNKDDFNVDDIYMINAFEHDLILPEREITSKEDGPKAYVINHEMLEELLLLLESITSRFVNVGNDETFVKDLLNMVALIVNVLSYLIKYKVFDAQNLDELVLRVNLKPMFLTLREIFCNHLNKNDKRFLTTFLEHFNMLMSANVCWFVASKVREYVLVELLNYFYTNVDCKEVSDANNVPLLCMKILSNFCCVKDCDTLSDIQKRTLTELVKPNYTLNDVDFDMTMTCLTSLKNCTPRTLPNDILAIALNSLQEVCRVRYTEYDPVLSILKLLYDLCPHIAMSNGAIKEQTLTILEKFYDLRNNYGSKVSVALIKCMGQMVKLDPEGDWSKWNDESVSLFIPEFLKSDYEEVRLTAIKHLLTAFSFTFYNRAFLLKQQRIFAIIKQKSREVFIIENTALSDERKVDESVTRTASAMHMYGSLITVSSVWRRKALFTLLELVYKKNLNPDLLDKLLAKIAKYLQIKNVGEFLDMYINYLLLEWNSNKYPLLNFPYRFLGCSSEMEFYSKYADSVVPLFIQEENVNAITSLSQYVGKSISGVVEMVYPKIAAFCFLKTSTSAVTDFGSKIYSTLENLLTNVNTNDLLLNNVDLVVINLIQLTFDVGEFKEQFSFKYDVLQDEEFFLMTHLKRAVTAIEKKLCINSSLMDHCISNFPNKIQNVLMNLTINMHKSCGTEDKLKTMHHYAIFVDLIAPFLVTKISIKEFLIKCISHTLLNLMTQSDSTVGVAACKYFRKLCSKILPPCAKTLEKFLSLIVNKLIPIANDDTQIGRECLKLLDFLIVENAEHFEEGIESLDPFPSRTMFNEINDIYLGVKYKKGRYSLKDEIKHFLNAGKSVNGGCRTEAVCHIRQQLSDRKDELKELYRELEGVRGFSEDCTNSVLHQLICVLVKLTASCNMSVSVEAARCLGELGSSDLNTIILQSENAIKDEKSNPLQFLAEHVIKLLSEYIVDTDVRVVQVSSKALYDVLDTKEGKLFIDTHKDSPDDIDTSHLTPFLTQHKIRGNSQSRVDGNMFGRELDKEDLWYPGCNHDTWIKELVCSILRCFPSQLFISKLIPICELKVSFSEQLLPYLIYLIVCNSDISCINIISNQMEAFFDKVWTLTLKSNKADTVQKQSVQCMLDVVHFVRLQASVNSGRRGYLSLNYLKVAQAAYFCSTYFATLLYVELWCQATITKYWNSSKTVTSASTMLEIICDNENEATCEILQTILRQAYTALEDIDALSGCGNTHLLDSKTRVSHLKQLGRWDQVVLHYDIQISLGDQEFVPELTDALKNCGLYQLALDYNKSKGRLEHECFWRLNQYHDNHTSQNIETQSVYDKCKHEALKSLCENDAVTFTEAVKEARNTVIRSLSCTSLQSTRKLYDSLMQLQSVRELEDLYEAKEKHDFSGILGKWKRQDAISMNDFKYVEPVKAQRISALSSLVGTGSCDELKNSLIELHLDLAGLARADGRFNVAKRAIGNFCLLQGVPDEYNGLKMLEEAQICWSVNDKPTGKYIMHQLMENSTENARLYFASLNLYGKWMAETCSENPQSIVSNYFLKSLKVMQDAKKTAKDCENIFETYDVLARFVDAEYQRILAYIKSTEFERKVQNMDKSRAMAAKIKAECGGRESDDQRRAIVTYNRQSKIDKTEIENTYKEKNTYLILAVKYYLLNLQYSDANNTRIFRIFSLWLDNSTNTDLTKLLNDYLPKIPTYKFIPILPQLVPHLSNSSEEEFGKNIYTLIERCAKEHPHHTLPILLALVNSNVDDMYCKVAKKTESNEPRVIGAKNLIENLKGVVQLRQVIANMEALWQAIIQLAYTDQSTCTPSRHNTNEKKMIFNIPARLKILQIKNVHDVLLPTCTLDVKKNREYSSVIGIHSFGREFENVGGINAPKRVTCRGTDGVVRSQLVKGKDDLRQDAVMQQVFTIMNGVLRSNKQTSKLLIRTFKVVPFSKRSGLIEWVDNSVKLGEYLEPAHAKYNRGDWSAVKSKRSLEAVKGCTNDVKLAKYKEICKNVHPVMHKFFETNFPQPTVWYERRQAYMHSVATSSMCGYILGLGDRHVQNILLDTITAEVIHVDFGIAFEQGRALPTPETVPFRLTRDIEDGMGVSGIEGVFRKSCEKTMEVLRQNSETITTIVEVLLYDPLYAWTITPQEAYSRQFDSNESNEGMSFSEEDKTPVNVTAERALLKLRQKLLGTEEGGASSVEGQVEKLLQQARDPANLSRLFAGWQPYL